MNNKAFSDWYDSLPYGEPSYQETFEAGAAHAREVALEEAKKFFTGNDTSLFWGSQAADHVEALKGK